VIYLLGSKWLWVNTLYKLGPSLQALQYLTGKVGNTNSYQVLWNLANTVNKGCVIVPTQQRLKPAVPGAMVHIGNDATHGTTVDYEPKLSLPPWPAAGMHDHCIKKQVRYFLPMLSWQSSH